MNQTNDFTILYEKMKLSLLRYKEAFVNNQSSINLFTKNIYSSLETFLKEILTITEPNERNRKIINTFKWFKQSIKENNAIQKRINLTKVKCLIPFSSNNIKVTDNVTENKNKEGIFISKKKIINFSDCFRATKKNFSFHNKNTNGNQKLVKKLEIKILRDSKSNPNYAIWWNNKNQLTKRNIKHENDFVNINILKKDTIISIDKKENSHSCERKNNGMNKTYHKKLFKHFKKRKNNFDLPKPESTKILKPIIAGNLPSQNSNNKIIDILHNIKQQENQYDIDKLNIPLKDENINQKTFYKDNYKSKGNTFEFRKSVSDFKYMELKSLRDFLKAKKRKYNKKSLHDAFINPEYQPQSTFFLPRGGSGLLSKPD